jgi:hypothetical protein
MISNPCDNYARIAKLLSPPGIRRTWKRLLDGHCGIVNVNHRDSRFADLPCQIAALVPNGKRKDGGWTASEWLSRDVRMIDNISCLSGERV